MELRHGDKALTFEETKDADGKEVECSMAEVRIRIDERAQTTVCVFGKADGQPALGQHTFDGLGLAVDQANSKLVPARLLLR